MKVLLTCGGLVLAAAISGCSASSSYSNSAESSRTLTAFDTYSSTAVVTDAFNTTERSCYPLTMDTSSCQASREALGLSGNWLKFSCNVVEGLATSSLSSTTNYSSATYVSLTSYDYPNYSSNYWKTSGSYDFTANSYTVTGLFDSLYEAYTTAFPDPGSINPNGDSLTMYIPLSPAAAASESEEMPMGEVGMAVNGVSIYDSMAGGTDNIFGEDGSFDQCGGHPDGSYSYHYHSDPFALSDAYAGTPDGNLIGVMRDGFFIYGAGESDTTGYTSSSDTVPGSQSNIVTYGDNNGDGLTGSSSDLYIYGGHVGVPPVGGSAVFHYHLTEWKGCYSESAPGTKNATDGESDDSYNASPSCTGTAYDVAVSGHSISAQWVDGWFLTGHGNGGVYEYGGSGQTCGTGSSNCAGYGVSGWANASPSQATSGIRYYYGTPGSCTGCHN